MNCDAGSKTAQVALGDRGFLYEVDAGGNAPIYGYKIDPNTRHGHRLAGACELLAGIRSCER